MRATAEETLRGSRRVVLSLHAATVTAFAYAGFTLVAESWAAAATAGILAAPLVAMTPSLVRASLFACRLTAILLVPYCCAAVMELVANPDERSLWALAAGLAGAELAALVGMIRRLQR